MLSIAARVEAALASLQVVNTFASARTATCCPVIGTHDGNFHCDEALACGLLRHTEQYKDAVVVRSRDEKELAQCNVVVDVGATFDPSQGRFDHHQREFTGTMNTGTAQYKTRLSSAGLVYQAFGREIIQRYVAAIVEGQVTQDNVDRLYDRVYKGFIEHIDGIDNGVEEFALSSAAKDALNAANVAEPRLERNYRVSTTLSERVGRLYPRWNAANSPLIENTCFAQAVKLATTEFFEAVDQYATSWLPAREVVARAFAAASSVHESGRIIAFEEGGCPWKEHLFDIENESGAKGRVLFVLFKDTKGGWRVMAVPEESSSFKNRKPLPWRGLRDAELCAASGIDGCVFVHLSGFIGGNRTYEGARAMAVKALETE